MSRKKLIKNYIKMAKAMDAQYATSANYPEDPRDIGPWSAIGKVGGEVGRRVGETVSAIPGYIGEAITGAGNFAKSIPGRVVNAAGNALTSSQPMQAIRSANASEQEEAVNRAIERGKQGIGESLYSGGNKLLNAIPGLRSPTEQAMGNARVKANELMNDFGNAKADFMRGYEGKGGYGNALAGKLGAAAGSARNTLNDIRNHDYKTDMEFLSDDISEAAGNAWNSAKEHGGDLWKATGKHIDNLSSSIGNKIEGAKALYNVGYNNPDATLPSSALTSLGQTARGLADRDYKKDLEFLSDDISEGASNAWNKVKEYGGDLVDSATNAWNSASPTTQNLLKYGGLGLLGAGLGYGAYKMFGGGKSSPARAAKPKPVARMGGARPMRAANYNGQPKGWITTRTGKKVPVYK